MSLWQKAKVRDGKLAVPAVILALVTICGATLTPAPAQQSSTVCPDLGKHQQVLQQGQTQLQQTRKFEHGRLQTRSSPDYGMQYDSLTTSLPDKLPDLNFDKDLQLNNAITLAYRYKRAGRRWEARVLLEQVLSFLDTKTKPSQSTESQALNQRGSVLEALAQLYVDALFFDIEGQKPNAVPVDQSESATTKRDTHADLYQSDPLLTLEAMAETQSAFPQGAQQLSGTPLLHNWAKAAGYFQRAIACRKKETAIEPHRCDDLVIDQLSLAVLDEFFNKPDALAIYDQLLNSPDDYIARSGFRFGWIGQTMAGPRTWAVDYMLRHNIWDRLQQLQKDIVDHTDFNASRELLRGYRTQARCTDAMKFFDLLASTSRTSKNGPLAIDAEGMCALIQICDDTHKQLLSDYTIQWLSAATNINAFQAPNIKSQEDEPIQQMAQALAAKGWRQQQQQCLATWVKLRPDDGVARLALAQLYLSDKQLQDATNVFQQLLGNLNKLSYGDKYDLDYCLMIGDRIQNLCHATTYSQYPGAQIVKTATEALQQQCVVKRQKLQCLAAAGELDKTGWELEKRDVLPAAAKMYTEALEIRRKNLGPYDKSVATDLVNLARIATAQNSYTTAANLYDQALAIFRHSALAHDPDLVTTIESYADMLQHAGQKAKADHLYDEARKLAAGTR